MPAENRIHLQDPRDRKTYYFHTTPLRRILTPAVKAFSRLLATLHCQGVTNLPQQGPVVLAANHVTNYDVFFMQFCLPRPIFFMGKAELFKNPLLGAILRQLGGFPVRRDARDDWAIRQAQKVLEQGQVLGIFPEGRRNHGRGLRAGKTGAARLAITYQCPIVPLAVNGSHLLFRGLSQRLPVTVTLSPPIFPQPFESALALTDRLMFAMAEMLPSEQRGVYALRPPGF
jgi:1-acyl-sn-glycerol-3-phosphate acyltransferase